MPQIFWRHPPLGAIFLTPPPPPNLKSWIRPWLFQQRVPRITFEIYYFINIFTHTKTFLSFNQELNVICCSLISWESADQSTFCLNRAQSTSYTYVHLSTLLQPYKTASITFNTYYYIFHLLGRRGHDRMVVGFTTTYAISTYHH